MSKNLLFLEDDDDYAQSVCAAFSSYRIKHTDDLVLFDSYLYEYPGANSYDFILMDLNVTLIDIDNDQFFKLCSCDNTVTPFELTKSRGLALIGWDYFVHKVMRHDSTKLLAYKKFYFITAHYDTINDQKILEANGISNERLLDKSTYYKRLAAILNKNR